MKNLKTSTAHLREMVAALRILAEIKLPTKAAFWTGRVLVKLTPDYAESEKAYNDIIIDLGTPNAEGQIEVSTNHPEYKKRLAELLGTEVEYDLPQIGLEQFDGISIEATTLMPLFDLIIEPAAAAAVPA